MFYFKMALFSVIASLGCGEPLCEIIDKKCKRIDSCPTALAMLAVLRDQGNKAKNTGYLEYLTKSRCGYEGIMLKVWCPGHCTTPDGRPGDCLDLKSCPTLTAMSNSHWRMSSTKTSKFLAKYRCAFPRGFFCCPLPSDAVNNDHGITCSDYATDLPPHPESGCCGIEEDTFRMKGGEPTNKFAWLALIDYKSKDLRCDGSLISRRYVLTAAHCADGGDYSRPWRVRLGEYNLQNPAKKCKRTHEYGVEICSDGTTVSLRIQVERRITHPRYRRHHFIHDIALLRLQKMATLSDYVNPICLPCSDVTARPPADMMLSLVGWDYNRISKQLLNVPYLDLNTCMTRYKNLLKLHQSHICAGGEANRSDCAGDSGGLVMYSTGTHFQLVAIITKGPVQCGIKYPSIHTKVFEYLDWIKKTILHYDHIFGTY